MIVALGVLALAIPAGAVAHHKESHVKGKGKNKTHNVAYVFKGTYAGESNVAVTKGNSRVRKGGFVGDTVSFDFSNARIVVADFNSDQKRDLADVQTGDRVLVKAKLPKKDPGSEPFEARKLVDKSNRPNND